MCGEHGDVPWEEEDSTALKWGGEFILILESALAVHCIYVPFSGKKKINRKRGALLKRAVCNDSFHQVKIPCLREVFSTGSLQFQQETAQFLCS